MATGFVQRWKGKVNAAQLWLGGVQINAAGADLNVNIGWGTVQTTTSSTGSTANMVSLSTSRVGGLDIFAPTANTGGSLLKLPAPVAGVGKLVQLSTINGSTIMFLLASTAGAVTFQGVGSTGSTASFFGTGGSTLSFAMKTTQSCQIELMGQSSVAWMMTGLVPSTVGHLTFSTST